MARTMSEKAEKVTIIKPPTGWRFIDFQELKHYRDLLVFLVWRDIKVIYAQTILGFAWAILQPLIQILLFTIIFGKVAKLASDGIPYVLFCSTAVIAWTYISQATSKSSGSLVAGQNLLGKIYFPRIIFPLVPILSKLLDFSISLSIIPFLFVYHKVTPTWNLLFLPLFILLMMIVALGTGLWLSAMAIRFRDVNHAMPFAIRMLMYTAPIVYSASSIPDRYRLIYSLNPVVAVIEGFRSSLLGIDFSWAYILPGSLVAVALLISGICYFYHMEHVFVDVI